MWLTKAQKANTTDVWLQVYAEARGRATWGPA